MQPKPLKIAEVVLAIIGAAGLGYWMFRQPLPVVRVTPTNTGPATSISASPLPESIDTSDWLTYTNPTYHITMKYPPFYKYTKRTNAFEAQDVPFDESGQSNYKDALNNHLKINVYTRALDGYQDTNMDYAGGGGDFTYAYRIAKGWYAVTTWSNQEGYLQDILPKEYLTKGGIKTHVSGTFSQGSAGVGWPKAKVAYIESPDKSFMMRLEIDFHLAEDPAKVTDQTIYQILDTLEMANSSVIYRNDQYGFTLTLPQSWEPSFVILDTWGGSTYDASGNTTASYGGPEITIHHTDDYHDRWQPVPIMVFTPAQWKLIESEQLIVSAAPYGPGEIGRNSKYIFAEPPRWIGFTDSLGQDEARAIMDSFKAF